MVKFLTVVVLLFIWTSVLASDDGKVVVPFLFTEDQQVKSSNFEDSIKKSVELKKNTVLNAPLTRLEYILMRLGTNLNDSDHTALVLSRYKEFFERYPLLDLEPKLEGTASYDSKSGKIVVSYELTQVGRPKKSLKSICQGLIAELEVVAPQQPLGFFYQNTAFGILIHDNPEQWAQLSKMIGNNIIQIGTIGSSPEKEVRHSFSCMKERAKAELIYSKSSFDLRKDH